MFTRVQVTALYEREVDVAERYADGVASSEELEEARLYSNSTAEHACMNTTEAEGGIVMADCAALNAAWAATQSGTIMLNDNGVSKARLVTEQTVQCRLLRDIIGNPYHPITIDPRWLTSDVIDLARTIYEQRAIDRMPILADALMDAGCDNADILDHCRGPGPHTRGCFVVDLILGKE